MVTKRPSLFAAKRQEPEEGIVENPADKAAAKRAPSRDGKRALTVYLDPLAWKQLRQLALDQGTSNQTLTEEALNLLFAKHGLNRSA